MKLLAIRCSPGVPLLLLSRVLPFGTQVLSPASLSAMAHFNPDSEVVPTPLADVPVLRDTHQQEYINEKTAADSSSDDVVGEKFDNTYDKGSSVEDGLEERKKGITYVNGEPVVSSGRDVSDFLIDIRDDGDPAITFRSLFLGTVFAGLGAALEQVSIWWHPC